MCLLKFYSEVAIFAKNLPATVDDVSMETTHKAIDEFSPVVKASNSLAMFLKANESDIKVCGETNGYFREVIDFKAKFDELITWNTNATSKMSQGVIDEAARMIQDVDAILHRFKEISNELKKRHWPTGSRVLQRGKVASRKSRPYFPQVWA